MQLYPQWNFLRACIHTCINVCVYRYAYVCLHTCVSRYNCTHVHIYLYSTVILVHMSYNDLNWHIPTLVFDCRNVLLPSSGCPTNVCWEYILGIHRSKEWTQNKWIKSIFLQLFFIYIDTNNLLHSFVYTSHRCQNITWDFKYHFLETLEFRLWGNAVDCL